MQGNLLSPDKISLTKKAPLAYRTGLIQPIDPLPIASRAALIFEKKAAAIGQEADVPAMAPVTPNGSVKLGFLTNSLSPAKARSGIPRKLVLYPNTGIWPEASLAFMYPFTAASCQSGRA